MPSFRGHEDPPTVNPDLLSPKSRRRLQKRLYMRRRRAKLQGQDPTETMDTMAFPGRLKPGRKTKRVDAPAPCPTRGSDTESDDQLPAKKHSQRGLTLPYKLRAIFSELGVDAAYLRAQGMDLIHLGALAHLRGCVCRRSSCFMFTVACAGCTALRTPSQME